MTVYTWKARFYDDRECAVEAESLEEAIEKKESGDWLFEETYDFGLFEELTGIQEDR